MTAPLVQRASASKIAQVRADQIGSRLPLLNSRVIICRLIATADSEHQTGTTELPRAFVWRKSSAEEVFLFAAPVAGRTLAGTRPWLGPDAV